ncbi:hypothetical protein BDY19DRAFT_979449 [Irpex rosettiformis]|uniref:Uncharacterized protein n=1 Tax=Irpex rosettiformis TaxID=378272 RepID=A0ACB8TMV3_9APHY|nr:hypothetical protein BDY19DRAFT_979449 [Irpex rosettiformis]
MQGRRSGRGRRRILGRHRWWTSGRFYQSARSKFDPHLSCNCILTTMPLVHDRGGGVGGGCSWMACDVSGRCCPREVFLLNFHSRDGGSMLTLRQHSLSIAAACLLAASRPTTHTHSKSRIAGSYLLDRRLGSYLSHASNSHLIYCPSALDSIPEPTLIACTTYNTHLKSR